MKTEAVMCMAFTRHRPSRTPLSRTALSTASVMFSNPTRSGTWKVSVLRRLFNSPPSAVGGEEGDDGVELLRQLVDPVVEKVADGQEPDDPIVVVDHREVAKVPFGHDLERLAHGHVLLRGDAVRGHDVADSRLSGILPLEHDADHEIALGEDSGQLAAFAGNGDGAYALVAH